MRIRSPFAGGSSPLALIDTSDDDDGRIARYLGRKARG